MNLKQLTELKELWQKRLRIQDWDVRIRIVTTQQMLDKVDADNLGLCMPYNMKKKADIWVLRIEDIPEGEDDQETILVHELMHLVMPHRDLGIKLNDDNAAFVAYERIIDQMARAFRSAYSK